MPLKLRLCFAAFLAVPLCGCATDTPESSIPIADTSLLALADPSNRAPVFIAPKAPPPSDIEARAAQAAINLQNLIDSGVIGHAQPAPANTPTTAVAPVEAIPGIAAASSEFVGPVYAPDPAAEDFDQVLDLARRVAALLRQEPDAAHPRVPEPVALAVIEGVQPGILSDLESPTNTLGRKLSAQDRQTLIKARDNILANPAGANDELVRSLSKLSPPLALKIARATLCTRVTGFGRYNPFAGDTFIARRAIRAIVYVELDGFTARPARDSDPLEPGLSVAQQVSVDLSQSVTLFRDEGGLMAWHRPARAVVETGRNKRRDFYLIQTIELPETLSIGRYNLKVTVKDNTTGAEAEAILPINIVADASALSRAK